MQLLQLFFILFIGIVGGSGVIEDSASLKSTIAQRAESPYPPCVPINPAPRRSICGTRGSYNGQPPQGLNLSQIVADLDACVNLFALPDNAAGSISFNGTSKKCSYSQSVIGSNFTANSNSDTIFYDFSCFNCPSYQCPLLYGINLLRNPSFDLSLEFSGPWQITSLPSVLKPPISVSPRGPNSTNAIHFPAQNGAALTSLIQYVAHCKGNIYSLSFEYKIANKPSANNIISVQFDDQSFEYLNNEPTHGSWVTFRDIYISKYPNGDGQGMFNFGIETDKTQVGPLPDVFLSNTNISSVSATFHAVPRARSVVSNGGFESGHLAPWVFKELKPKKYGKYDSNSIVSPGLGGSSYAFQFSNSDSADFVYDFFSLSQTLTLVPGAGYLFTMDVRGFAFEVIWRIGTREFRGLHRPPYGRNSTTVSYEAVFMAQADTADLVLQVAYINTNESGTVLIDNVRILELVLDV